MIDDAFEIKPLLLEEYWERFTLHGGFLLAEKSTTSKRLNAPRSYLGGWRAATPSSSRNMSLGVVSFLTISFSSSPVRFACATQQVARFQEFRGGKGNGLQQYRGPQNFCAPFLFTTLYVRASYLGGSIRRVGLGVLVLLIICFL